MKKIKVFSVLLLGSLFGLASCNLPDFMLKIPGVSKLATQQTETEKEEKTSEQGNENQNSNQNENQNQNQNNTNGNENNGNGNENNNNTTAAIVDTLTRESTGLKNGSSSYTAWTYTSTVSKVKYSGKSAAVHDSIQLRSKDSDSGVVSTTSAGKISKVTVEFEENTLEGRTLNVYGSSSAYSKPSDLFGNKKGTLLGTIVNGTSTSLTISGSYDYVGVCSAKDAMYLTSITFEWNGDSTGTGTNGNGNENGNGGEENTAKTVESVVADLEEAFGMQFEDETTHYALYLDCGEEGVTYSDTKAGESVLKPVTDALLLYMPDYLELAYSHFYTTEEDYWDDDSGDTAYSVELEVDEVTVELIGYVYNGSLCGQVCVY